MAEQLAGVRLTEDETRLAAYLVRAGASALKARNGALPAAVIALRDQLDMFARRISFAQASASDEPANLIGDDDRASSGLLVGRVSVAEVAGRTGFSAQHVRRLCHLGGLHAHKGPGGAWLIDRSSAAALAASKGRTAGD